MEPIFGLETDHLVFTRLPVASRGYVAGRFMLTVTGFLYRSIEDN